jgi:protein phosphatase
MANTNHAQNAEEPVEGTPVPETAHNGKNSEKLEITDKDIEKLLAKIHPVYDAEELTPDQADIRSIQKEISAKQPVQPPHITYGAPDSKLQLPFSKTSLIPKEMYAAAGNEEGHAKGTFTNANFGIVTDYPTAEIRNKPTRIKAKNDDGYLVDEQTGTMIVTDGVGGNYGGEIASSVTLYVAAKALEKSKKQNTPPVPLEELIQQMHSGLLEYQQHNKIYGEASAVVSAVRVNKDKTVMFANAGDAVGLLIRNGKVIHRTPEDNYLNFLMLSKGMSEEEVRYECEAQEGYFTAVTQCLGKADNVIDAQRQTVSATKIAAHTSEFQAEAGDIALVCSDGLTNALSEEEIAEFITNRQKEGIPVAQIIIDLKEYAAKKMKEGKAHIDNVTVGAIEIL